MGGLSLGGFLAARYGDRVSRPLVWYGLIGIGIGVYGLSFSHMLPALLPLHRLAYQHWFDAAPHRYHAFRVLVAAATLLPPTTAMGATLPLIVRRFVTRDGEFATMSGFFYAMNT